MCVRTQTKSRTRSCHIKIIFEKQSNLTHLLDAVLDFDLRVATGEGFNRQAQARRCLVPRSV